MAAVNTGKYRLQKSEATDDSGQAKPKYLIYCILLH